MLGENIWCYMSICNISLTILVFKLVFSFKNSTDLICWFLNSFYVKNVSLWSVDRNDDGANSPLLLAVLLPISHLSEKPQKSWQDAVTRWFEEAKHKRTLNEDRKNLRWAHPYLYQYLLCHIDADLIESMAKAKEATGVAPATVNRLLAVIRSILRKAKDEWGWISDVPKIRMRKEANERIRWLTPIEANRLLAELPEHLKNMAGFTLATGLRASNVTGLCWQDVNLERAHTLIYPDQSTSKKAMPIPLNEDALVILMKQLGKHPVYVFTYENKPVKACNTRAWRNALSRANIENFRWHDLRHTWASWHVQNGTSLQELQHLGAWSSFNMVLRYAHLSSAHLRKAALRMPVTNWLHLEKTANKTVTESVVAY